MPTRRDILERNQLLIETAEERAARAVAGAYNRARMELVDSLISRWDTSAIMTPNQAMDLMRRLSLINTIDARLKTLEGEVGSILRGVVNSATELALEQVGRELKLLPKGLLPDIGRFAMVDTATVERFVPIVMNDIQGITGGTLAAIQSQLQTGLITGQSFPDLIRRAFSVEPTDGVSPWANGRTSAELLTRRTVITANNAAKEEALAKVNERAEGVKVQKQAVATVQSSTTDTCLRVHGQIRDIGQPFTLEGKPRFAREMMHPSFHWRCRTSEAMYHPYFERGGLTTANMQTSAKAELDRRAAAKRPAVVAPKPTPAPKIPPAYDLSEGAKVRAAVVAKHKAISEEAADLLDRAAAKTQEVNDRIDAMHKAQEATGGFTEEEYLIRRAGIKAAQKERDELERRAFALQAEQRDRVRAELAVEPSQRANIKYTWDSTFKGRKGVTALRERFSEAQAFVKSITTNADIDLKIFWDTTGRAAANPSGIKISAKTGTGTIAHEIAHNIEFVRGAAGRVKRMAFFDKRTAGDPLEYLADIHPGWGYKPDEVTKRDKWGNLYSGRVYAHDSDTYSSSEVITMGVQALYEDTVGFAERDPEYFDFVVSYLRGTL